jgi:hypothetical protein
MQGSARPPRETADETAGDDAEVLGVEIAQIDDVDRHGGMLARICFLVRTGLAWPAWASEG